MGWGGSEAEAAEKAVGWDGSEAEVAKKSVGLGGKMGYGADVRSVLPTELQALYN
ncbi:MAG: hypothetical protein GX279_10045 [Clostridiaceae bacterium]|nr:hypothetical protein [Clostridiaceae bacterium]